MAADLPPISQVPVNRALLEGTIGSDARTVLEIGANDGMHTVLFLESFPQAHVHAFEPDPRAAAAFRSNVRDRRVTLHELAIGASNGRADFHLSGGVPPDADAGMKQRYRRGWDQSGSLRAPKLHLDRFPWCKFVRTASVEVRTLDTWSRKHAPGMIDFIWADVQGAEADLVRGGPETLARTRFLFTEYCNVEMYEGQPSLQAILGMLPGFEVVRRFPDDVLLRNVALASAPSRA